MPPAGWDGYTLTRKWRGATYEIEVRNPSHVAAGVASIEVDGRAVSPVPDARRARQTARLPIAEAGTTQRIVVVMG